MCVICENFEIGDMLPPLMHNGECYTCGNKFSVMQETPLWVYDLPHSHNGSLLHVTNDIYVCKCGTELSLGFYCQGISGDGLFTERPEYADAENKGIWETIKTAFGKRNKTNILS